MSREWTVVLRGDWYLPHLINMLNAYRGNSEQRSCADEMIEQVRQQMVDVDGTSTTRPLAVIDAEDSEQVARLAFAIRDNEHPGWAEATQAALREFANPKPPKPDEPTGLGAVVECEDGATFVRTHLRGRPAVTADDITARPYLDHDAWWDSLDDDQRAEVARRRKVLGSLDDTYALNRWEAGR